ncbi:MAG: hypothetical protein ACM31C_03555 [Acidobacteriota bacterium]
MKPLVAAVLALAACSSSTTDNRPYEPGGGGATGGNGGGQDAAVDGNDGGQLAGRVCLAADPRDLVTCASTGAGGLTVTLGTAMATTADDGTFAITAPQGTGLVWHASGGAIATSVMPFGTVAQIPALATTTYDDLVNGNGILLASGQGSIFVRVLQAGAPLAGATATATPASPYETHYDGATAATWGTTATGAHGVAWIAGEATGAASVTVTPAGGSAQTIDAVPVEDGALTFVATEFP